MVENQTSVFDPEDQLDAKEVYYFVCQAFDVGHNGKDANLSYEQFVHGSTIWAWTTSPDMDANNGVALLQKPGNFECDIYMSSTAANAGLTALFFGKCTKSVHIGKENRVTLV